MAAVAEEIFTADEQAFRSRVSRMGALASASTAGGRPLMRVTWVQPEDLVRHELWQSEREGRDTSDIRARWAAAGTALEPPYVGASPEVATAEQRTLAEELLLELDALPDVTADSEPSDWSDDLRHHHTGGRVVRCRNGIRKRAR